jgi:hypothetical protein
MAGHDEEKRDRPSDVPRERRAAAVREALARDAAASDATEALTALMDALDWCRRGAADLRDR